ncbi:MAG: hypothetical protein V1661_03590 [bacterium]
MDLRRQFLRKNKWKSRKKRWRNKCGNRKKKRNKKSAAKNLHHLNPRSRIPELICELNKKPQKFFEDLGLVKNAFINKLYTTKRMDMATHSAWHILFFNLFAWEAVALVKLWANHTLTGFAVDLDKKQRKAWDLVFGQDATPKQAVKIIKNNWWPKYPAPGQEKIFEK